MVRSRRILATATFTLALGIAQAQPDSNQLPVKRVVLYKNGVGYFEHVGRVRGNQEVNIPFTSGQLNDVLKSLTVLDLGGGRITGVGYGSSAPVDRQIGDLRLPVDEKSSLTEFLGALRGARIEIKSNGVSITGRMLSIESEPQHLQPSEWAARLSGIRAFALYWCSRVRHQELEYWDIPTKVPSS